MNKILSKIMAVMLVVVACFAMTACNQEVENRVKIKRVTFVVTFYDDNGAQEDYTLTAKLYENYAPKTIAHVIDLINSGYYNGKDITNVTSTYCQVGDYTRENNTLTALDQGNSILGEFRNKGWSGNQLAVEAGSILLNHDEEGTDSVSKYDTGKATLVFTFSNSAPFTSDAYAVIGKFLTDDGDSEADEESMAHKSSKDKILEIAKKVANDDGTKLFYAVKNRKVGDELNAENQEINLDLDANKYITYAKSGEEYHYYFGTPDKVGSETQLTKDQETALKTRMEKHAKDFMCLPTTRVVIKSASINK